MARPRGFLRASVGTGARNEHDDVIQVKQLLKELGFYEPDGEIDDTIDKATDQSLRHAQEQLGLTVDGRVTPGGETERNLVALKTGEGFEPALGPENLHIRKSVGEGGTNDPADVATVKRAFGALGTYRYDRTRPPPPYIDTKLVDTIRGLQRDRNLQTDGRMDPDGETLKALQKAEATVPKAGEKSLRLERVKPAITQSERKPRLFRATGLSPVPATPLTTQRRKDFAEATGLEISNHKNALELTDRESGNVVARMSEANARELVHNWESLAPRVKLLGLFGRTDLSADEKIAEADRLLPSVDQKDFGIKSMRTPIARAASTGQFQKEHHQVENARKAFRDAVSALVEGKSKNEVLPELQAHLFPEIYDEQRALREFGMDLFPGIGNLRSAGHAWNDVLEIRDAMSQGNMADAGRSTVMLLLDGLGIIPGGNVVTAGGRQLLKITPYGEAMLGQAKLSRLQRQFSDLSDPAGPSRLFKTTFDALPATTKKALTPNVNAVMGGVGERQAMEIARMIDPRAGKPSRLTLPNEAPGTYRTHDLKTRDLKTVVFDDVMAAYAKLAGQGARSPSPGKHFEIKSGAAKKTDHQEDSDNWLTENPEKAKELGVHGVSEARVLFKQLPLDDVLKDMRTRFDTMVGNGTISASVADSLFAALQKEITNGTRHVRAVDYADLMFRLAAASIRPDEAPSNRETR